MAAAQALRQLQSGADAGADYAMELHAHYDRLFLFSQRLRDWCSSAWGVSTLALGAMARPDLKLRLVGCLIGGDRVPALPSAGRLLRVLLRPASSD
jgi:hypothetical protein